MDLEHERTRALANEDRISSLPDELIHHILSFVDVKCAIQTSLLSSRWKIIWKFLPHLNFSFYGFRTLPKFSKFVNNVLNRRNNSTQVYTAKFGSRGVGVYTQRTLKRIASYVESHNVQEITLHLHPGGNHELPTCLFNSQSLKKISLTALTSQVDDVLNLPKSPWNLPALTSLHLNFISFLDDNTSKSLDFFSKCVNLTTLTLYHCSASKIDVFNISAPQLAHLTIRFCWIEKFEISAPKLSSFVFVGSQLHLSTDGFHHLDKVNLCISMNSYLQPTEEDAYRVVRFLHNFNTAKLITLDSGIIECLSSFPEQLEIKLSKFSNLKCLKIENSKPKRKAVIKTLPNHVRNYFLDHSPCATVIMKFAEEPPRKVRKSKKQLEEEACARVKAEFEAKIESERAALEVEIEQSKARFEAETEQRKAMIEAMIPTDAPIHIDRRALVDSVEEGARADMESRLTDYRLNREAIFTRAMEGIETIERNMRSSKRAKPKPSLAS